MDNDWKRFKNSRKKEPTVDAALLNKQYTKKEICCCFILRLNVKRFRKAEAGGDFLLEFKGHWRVGHARARHLYTSIDDA